MFTTLTKEALPLIRYRTGDLGALTREPCACGRTTARLTGLRGRRDDMVIVRGVNLYPSHVEHALLSVDGVAPHYRLIVERNGPDGRADRASARPPAASTASAATETGTAAPRADRGADSSVSSAGARVRAAQRGKAVRVETGRQCPDRRRRGNGTSGSWIAAAGRRRRRSALERRVADLARGDPERALEHAREVRGVAEPPAERDVGHGAAVGPLQVLQAAGQPLGAYQPGHRLVDVLEQRVQRSHRHRVGARDRGRARAAGSWRWVRT